MAFHRGTATDYKDLLEDLKDFCTGDSVSGVTINAAGSGYSVGDVLTISGGTADLTATLEVTAVSGTAITGIRIRDAGAYTATPSNPVSVTGGGGSSATFNLTWDDTGWTLRRDTQYFSYSLETLGGTGYQVGDQLTVSGGSGVAATIMVTGVAGGGVIDEIAWTNRGRYTSAPSLPANLSGGNGSGAQLASGTTIFGKELMMEGEGSGSDQIFVGIRTYYLTSPSGPVTNWELAGFTGFASGVDWSQQPGISTAGAFVTLNDASMPYWFSVNGRRIIVIARDTSDGYNSCYLGFINPFFTSAELPYPLLILGTAGDNDIRPDTSIRATGSVLVPHTTIPTGPGYFRRPGGDWKRVVVSQTATQSYDELTLGTAGIRVTPFGRVSLTNNLDAEDRIVTESGLVGSFSEMADLDGTPSYELWPTPDSGGDKTVLTPETLVENDSAQDQNIYGEIDGVFWCPGYRSTTITPESRIIDGSDYYSVFRSGNQSSPALMFAVREE